jgi:hypothetical protein
VLLERAGRLRGAAAAAVPALQVPDVMPGREGCPACAVEADTVREATRALAGALAAEPDHVASLSAVCLPHLACVAAELGEADVLRDVLRREAQVLERLAETMLRFAVKQDASRRGDMSHEETTASRDALGVLTGHPNADFAAARAVSRANMPESAEGHCPGERNHSFSGCCRPEQ